MTYERKDKVGDTLEVSLWYNSEKPGEYQSAVEGISMALNRTEDLFELRLGPVETEVLEPGDERVPDPNPDFAGTPKLLIGWATVIYVMTSLEGYQEGFTEDLDEEALQTLRKVTQIAYMKNKPANHLRLTDEQLDIIINEVGPETAIKNLRTGTDNRSII